jgi:hypothetical protein
VPLHVPDELEEPAGNKAFLKGHAIGTQNYICLPSASGVSWTFFGPQATLFNSYDVQIITHFLSRNRDESDTPRPTWQHSRDSSTVWARAQREFPVGGTIPWLLLEVVGSVLQLCLSGGQAGRLLGSGAHRGATCFCGGKAGTRRRNRSR